MLVVRDYSSIVVNYTLPQIMKTTINMYAKDAAFANFDIVWFELFTYLRA